MLNMEFYGKCASLATGITPRDTQIRLRPSEGSKFAMRGDDHFYLTLKNGGTREVVKVVARNGDLLTVERAQDNTAAQSFGRGACACVEWNPQQLCEFVKNCTQGCTGITPQTVVVTCGTALKINECGNIVSVNGSEKC